MSALKIERMLALIDPVGLIKMGAPVDEYSTEATNIHRLLRDDFTDSELLEAYLDAMHASFTPKIFKGFKNNDDRSIIHYVRDGVDPSMKFDEGQTYRVLDRPLGASLFLKLLGRSLRSSEIITCVGRTENVYSGHSMVMVLMEGSLHKAEISFVDEYRARWFFEEVK